jgi:hypothetical protein
VNFSDVEDFEAIPEGEYGAEVDKVEVRRNKADDGDYLNWEFVILDGDYENRRLWLITSLKPTALFRLKDIFEQLDVLEGDEMELEYDDDQDVTTSSGPRLLYPDVEGMEVSIRVKNETYDGKERNKVESVYTERQRKRGRNDRKTTRQSASDSKRTRSRRSRRDEEEYDVDEDDDDEDDEEEESPRRRSRSSTNRRESRSRNTDSERPSRRSSERSGRRRLR